MTTTQNKINEETFEKCIVKFLVEDHQHLRGDFGCDQYDKDEDKIIIEDWKKK